MLDGLVGAWESRDDYRRYVQGIADFRMPMEALLGSFVYPPAWSGFRALTVSREMARDLTALGLPPAHPGPQWQGNHDVATLLGLLYTLEGSNLGAQVLLKRAAALGFSAETGCAHLERQACAVGHWRTYLELLEATPDLDMDQVCAAACSAFDLARQSFERVVCERC